MRETSIRRSFLALLVLALSAASSFAQSGGDREQMSPPVGRYRVAPLSVGRVIVATRSPHETLVLQTIRDLGLELVRDGH